MTLSGLSEGSGGTDMTGEEKYRILDSIKLENGFFLIDEQDCREENAALI